MRSHLVTIGWVICPPRPYNDVLIGVSISLPDSPIIGQSR